MARVVWEDQVDKKYPCQVVADDQDPYKGVLTVMDGDKEILKKDVGISFGGPFGPDAGDVSIWCTLCCNAVDEYLGKTVKPVVNQMPRYMPIGMASVEKLQVYHDTETDEYVMDPHGERKVVPKPEEPVKGFSPDLESFIQAASHVRRNYIGIIEEKKKES